MRLYSFWFRCSCPLKDSHPIAMLSCYNFSFFPLWCLICFWCCCSGIMGIRVQTDNLMANICNLCSGVSRSLLWEMPRDGQTSAERIRQNHAAECLFSSGKQRTALLSVETRGKKCLEFWQVTSAAACDRHREPAGRPDFVSFMEVHRASDL